MPFTWLWSKEGYGIHIDHEGITPMYLEPQGALVINKGVYTKIARCLSLIAKIVAVLGTTLIPLPFAVHMR